MYRNRIILLIIIMGLPLIMVAQGKLEGKITEDHGDHLMGLPGASVYWSGTSTGTTTNNVGYFELKRSRSTNKLVVSFIGFKPDTIIVGDDQDFLEHVLTPGTKIDEVLIVGKAAGTHIDRINAIHTINITGAELRKAACCNLSESFETNASVDVTYSDAATGAKQIQLLGLSGTYVQLMTENIPAYYGLSSAYGLNYIPGPWIESIHVAKGAGAVRNGHEAITGQINIEYKKPAESELLYLNLFGSDAGRIELNATTAHKVSNRLSTMVMLHAEDKSKEFDHNMDNFRDEPNVRQINVFNRWDYFGGPFTVRAGIKFLAEERIGGQLNYTRNNPDTWTNGYGINITTKRADGFAKIGYVFPSNPDMSIGWIHNFSTHTQISDIGLNNYEGKQDSYFSSLLYQYAKTGSKHTYDAGINTKLEKYDETLDGTNFLKQENEIGAFVQHSYNDSARITFLSGIRGDYNNRYGLYITPRFHVRYSPFEWITLRAAVGSGYRSANVLAENTYLLASSRSIVIDGDLDVERALNSGLSITSNTQLLGNDLALSAEIHHTEFSSQVITDMDATVNEIRFYNLDGRSYSTVLQFEALYKPIKGLDMLMAWRINDVKMTIDGTLRDRPLTSRYKGLFTLSYLTNLRKWQYDYTLQFNGPGRIPSTAANPVQFRVPESFDSFSIMNAQITRYFRTWNIYLGVENLTNFRQEHPIIDSADPFGSYFDSSLIYGPIHGRKIYAGLRITINKEN